MGSPSPLCGQVSTLGYTGIIVPSHHVVSLFVTDHKAYSWNDLK